MDEGVALDLLKGKTVAIDFDGVVHAYSSGWTGPAPTDPPTPGAREFIEMLLEAGVNPVIYSTRCNTEEGLLATREWFAQHGIPLIPMSCEKPKAVAYIDDRAVVFRGSWGDALTDAAWHALPRPSRAGE